MAEPRGPAVLPTAHQLMVRRWKDDGVGEKLVDWMRSCVEGELKLAAPSRQLLRALTQETIDDFLLPGQFNIAAAATISMSFTHPRDQSSLSLVPKPQLSAEARLCPQSLLESGQASGIQSVDSHAYICFNGHLSARPPLCDRLLRALKGTRRSLASGNRTLPLATSRYSAVFTGIEPPSGHSWPL